MYPQPNPLNGSGRRHVAPYSQDTTASRTTESTISFAHFPQTPASIPYTPLSKSGSTPLARNHPSPRLGSRKPLPVPGAASTVTYNFVSENKSSGSNLFGHSGRSGTLSSQSPSFHRPAPSGSSYNWYDASSIGMDAAEDRLLSTSFITSLLRDSSSCQANKRQSFASDASNSFSEMTYSPLASSSVDGTVDAAECSSGTRLLPYQVQARWNPSSSLAAIRESPLSGESPALYCANQGAYVRKEDRGELHNSPPKPIISRDDSRSVYSEVYTMSRDNSDVAILGSPPIATSDFRKSIQSTKSAASSFVSRLSSDRSMRRVLAWWKVKPLPPVPLIAHIPIATESEYRRAEELASLSDLANRANTLQGYLEKGYHPHHSIQSSSYNPTHKGQGLASTFDGLDAVHPNATGATTSPAARFRVWSRWRPKNSERMITVWSMPFKKRWIFILLGIFLVICLAAVGTIVGIIIDRQKPAATVCPNNLAGAACDLNSTCVCTSPYSGHCSPLAQNIVDLVPILNQLFLSNQTSNDVYKAIWLMQSSLTSDCTSQSVLVDVAPALTLQILGNVTRWAQAALLWNIVESQNLTANAELQSFIQAAPWHTLNDTSEISLFTTTVSGFIFDFAAQVIRQPNISFITTGQPTAAQLSQVGSTAQSALNRMYSFASASSIQHQKALENYWTNVLGQNLTDLPTFTAAFSVSPILLPFDATLAQQPTPLNSLLTSSSIAPFPPPLSCYPRLDETQLQLINAIEGRVFGLSTVSSTDRFDSACYPDRPIYGVMNVLRLRQPFLDQRLGTARQAAVLKRDVNPRAIIRLGAILSPLPGPTNVSVVTVDQSDPRQYGTLGQFNHVVLQYLSSIPNVEVATAFVSYVLASATTQAVPPSSTSILFKSLSMIPVIEVAIFGTVTPPDIDSAASAFTTSSGSLFFGSDQGTALRNWVIAGCSSITIWAESPLSPIVVRDNDFSDRVFNQTWVAISNALHNDIPDIGLVNITDTFEMNNKFTSS